jgi:hypothetical protein
MQSAIPLPALVLILDERYFLWCAAAALLDWHYMNWRGGVE